MLERIREGSQGPVAKSILGLVIVTFALAGVGSYINSGSEPKAASVNGTDISLMELERSFEQQKQQMQQQYGEMFNAYLNNPIAIENMRKGALDNLISERLISELAADLSIRVSDDQVREIIFEMPDFQVDGKFSNDAFVNGLKNRNTTPADYQDVIRNAMIRNQIATALVNSEFVLDSEAKSFQALQSQTRDIEYFTVDVNQFSDSVEVTDEQIESHYQSNIIQFETQQQIAVEYIELKMSDVAANIVIDDAAAKAHYEANSQAYLKAERRRASHILIDNSDEQAKQKIEDILAEIQQGADFAELAKTHSTDTFSGENGGDLDFFGKGMMDPAFESATYAIENIGDVSDIVESSFGFHIIKLTDVEPEQLKSFDEVKDQIVSQLQFEQSSDIFSEKLQSLKDVSFELPESLAPTAKETGLAIKTADLFEVSNAPYPFSESALLEATLDSEVIDEGFNSKVVEVSGDHYVVVNVSEHIPARIKALDEVKEQVTQAVSKELAKSVAQTWIESLNQKWQSGEDISSLIFDKQINIKTQLDVPRFGSEVPAAIARKAFEMSAPNDNLSTTWLEIDATQFAAVKLNKVNEKSVDTVDDATKQRLSSSISNDGFQALINALRENADIKVFKSNSDV